MLDAFNEFESSLNNDVDIKHRGIGLNEVHNFIKERSGYAEVSSGNTIVEVTHNGELKSKSLNYKLCGVLFKMEIPF